MTTLLIIISLLYFFRNINHFTSRGNECNCGTSWLNGYIKFIVFVYALIAILLFISAKVLLAGAGIVPF